MSHAGFVVRVNLDTLFHGDSIHTVSHVSQYRLCVILQVLMLKNTPLYEAKQSCSSASASSDKELMVLMMGFVLLQCGKME